MKLNSLVCSLTRVYVYTHIYIYIYICTLSWPNRIEDWFDYTDMNDLFDMSINLQPFYSFI